jgi:Colicin V production protein
MVFSALIILLLGAIVFFHYLQGFFSSLISAVLTVVAAVLAFSWHEVIVEKYLQGKMADYAHAMVLIVLFAVIYLVLRTAFDKMIPGAVRLPAAADKLGGALMGVVAGIFATGVFAVAAEEMPFGPSVAMYSRYEVQDREATVTRTNSRSLDATTSDELHSEDAGRFNPVERKIIYPPVDDLFVGAVRRLSETGSLQGDQPLGYLHPDFLTEIYGQRSGVQPAGGHVTMHTGGSEPTVRVESIYQLGTVQLSDNELHSIRATMPKTDLTIVRTETKVIPPPENTSMPARTLKLTFAAAGKDKENSKDQILIAVRVVFGKDASDREDWLVRFSPAGIRLVAKKLDAADGEKKFTNYIPMGTVENTKDGMIVYLDKPDDFLIADAKEKPACVDLVFAVDKDGFLAGEKERKIADGTFLEVKRMAREDLSGKPILGGWQPVPADTDSSGVASARYSAGIIHKDGLEEGVLQQPPAPSSPAKASAQPANPTPPGPANPANPANPTPPDATAAKMLNVTALKPLNTLPVAVGMPNSEVAKPLITIAGAIEEATLKDKKYQHLKVDPLAPVDKLSTGEFKTRELYVPEGQTLVQVLSSTPADEWAWAKKAPDMKMTDSAGAQHSPAGIWAIVSDGGVDKLFARYDGSPEYPLAADLVNPVPTQGHPSQIVVAFLIPSGTTPKDLKVDGQQIKDLSTMPMTKGQ